MTHAPEAPEAPEGFVKIGPSIVCRECGAIVPPPSKAAPVDGPALHREWHEHLEESLDR